MSSSVHLPLDTRIYYLDTCVWSALAESEAGQAGSISYFQPSGRAVALSYFSLFELSRAPKIFAGIDSLFSQWRHKIHIPCLYDQVIESELKSFPRTWKMRWLPLSLLVDESNLRVLQALANNPRFVRSRDDHYQFGLEDFMSLEQLKENFPPLHGDEYIVDDASCFAWGTAMDYLGRHFPHFLKAHWKFIDSRGFASLDSLLSLRIRPLFVFFKYYLHGQSPRISDFLDFAHVSYAPYCSVFVTDQDVCNILKRIKSNGLMLYDTEIVHVSDFVGKMSKVSDPV